MLRYLPWVALGVFFIQRLQAKPSKDERRKIKIGFIGYSTQSFDRDKAQIVMEGVFESLEKKYPSSHWEIEIVSGLTDIGIPGMVYAEATKRKWPTAGFACSRAKNYKCHPCDNVVIIGHNWGDESNAFLEYIDELIKLGGGEQSTKEYEKCTKTKRSFTWH
eukprot:Phypoly_transcript_17459.p1 GENE.Phypoly_transcript_17459~~Phypoly_transcript_17459.p1  ORF type:complete len:162 (-),score=15.31 Phypoly_transcript_17459:58-543(-)